MPSYRFRVRGERTTALMILVWCCTVACTHAVRSATVEDALIVARIRTVNINDPELGARPVHITVASGTAELTGQVASAEELARLETLVRAVDGVKTVRMTVRVGGSEAVAPIDRTRARSIQSEPLESAADSRLLALGASLSWTRPQSSALGHRLSAGPLIRLGSGRGFAPDIAFDWFAFDLSADPGRLQRLGRVNVRPLMAGAAYTWSTRRLSAGLSLVGGVAFNSLQPTDDVKSGVVALRIASSPLWRPGLSIWYDVNRRVALNLTLGYAMLRPSVTYLEQGEITTRTLRADTLLISSGLAYKLF